MPYMAQGYVTILRTGRKGVWQQACSGRMAIGAAVGAAVASPLRLLRFDFRAVAARVRAESLTVGRARKVRTLSRRQVMNLMIAIRLIIRICARPGGCRLTVRRNVGQLDRRCKGKGSCRNMLRETPGE